MTCRGLFRATKSSYQLGVRVSRDEKSDSTIIRVIANGILAAETEGDFPLFPFNPLPGIKGGTAGREGKGENNTGAPGRQCRAGENGGNIKLQ